MPPIGSKMFEFKPPEEGNRCVPSVRKTGSTVTLSLFDVIAEDGTIFDFPRHTGLASQPGESDRGAVSVYNMGPPLHSPGSMKADAIGMAELDESEARKIKVFIDRHEGEHLAMRQIIRIHRQHVPQMYCILPHAAEYQENGRYVRMRFSCSGFVLEAYRKARINLIDESRLPQIGLDSIKKAYPEHAGLLDHASFRESMGLVGAGPWPVMLCGYVIHALNRDKASIRNAPHSVGEADAVFSKEDQSQPDGDGDAGSGPTDAPLS